MERGDGVHTAHCARSAIIRIWLRPTADVEYCPQRAHGNRALFQYKRGEKVSPSSQLNPPFLRAANVRRPECAGNGSPAELKVGGQGDAFHACGKVGGTPIMLTQTNLFLLVRFGGRGCRPHLPLRAEHLGTKTGVHRRPAFRSAHVEYTACSARY